MLNKGEMKKILGWMNMSGNWLLKTPRWELVDEHNKRKIYLRQIYVQKYSREDRLESRKKRKKRKFKLFKISDFSLDHGVWKNWLKKRSTRSIMAIYKASRMSNSLKKKKLKKMLCLVVGSAIGTVEISRNSCKPLSFTLKKWSTISQITSAPKPLKKLKLTKMFFTKMLINSMIVSKLKKYYRDVMESTILKSQLLSW